MSSLETASVEQVLVDRDGPVARITINRPDVHNALNAAVLAAIGRAVDELAGDGRTRAIIVTGAGTKAFSAGADLDELTGLTGEEAHAVLGTGQRILRRIETCGVPVVAAVNGLALGGGFELVLASTVVVAAEHATFGLPEAGLGLIPGYGGTQRLAGTVGRHAALHLMLTGARLAADRAFELGLLAVPPVPAAALPELAAELAAGLASRSPWAVRSILAATDRAAGSPAESGLMLETALAALATAGSDAAEGIAAFRSKRLPTFAGRP